MQSSGKYIGPLLTQYVTTFRHDVVTLFVSNQRDIANQLMFNCLLYLRCHIDYKPEVQLIVFTFTVLYKHLMFMSYCNNI